MKINSCFLCVFLLSVPVESVTVMAADLSPVNGNGKVSLSMILEEPTCKVSVENTTQSFNVSNVDNKGLILPNVFTAENCKGHSLDFKVIFSTPVPQVGWWGPTGYAGVLCHGGVKCLEDTDPAVVFYVVIPDGTKGVSGDLLSGRVPDSSTGKTVTIEPDSNNYTFNANTVIPVASVSNGQNGRPGRISGSYTYVFSFK
ncbi:hypothetical protein Q6Y00_003301 [Salmonella enterica]|nr:hypothetical protein [Salmonella enterica]ELK9206954.1 hypothetical protein [Salmonella enterica]ELK9220050.1 hypothetical protein [Salmonella enterica]ELK9221576.1 hypothetical protein [Salmonella enterica]ELK9233190.1 hypothetical protein [Salmonella enterica]